MKEKIWDPIRTAKRDMRTVKRGKPDEDGFVDLWQLYEWDFVKGVRAVGSDTGG